VTGIPGKQQKRPMSASVKERCSKPVCERLSVSKEDQLNKEKEI